MNTQLLPFLVLLMVVSIAMAYPAQAGEAFSLSSLLPDLSLHWSLPLLGSVIGALGFWRPPRRGKRSWDAPLSAVRPGRGKEK